MEWESRNPEIRFVRATGFYAGDKFALFLDLRSMGEWPLWKEVEIGVYEKNKFSSQLTGKHQVQGMVNVSSSSSQMLISTSLTVSLKAWLINEISSHLQWRCFDRRTSQCKPRRGRPRSGTPWLLCEKIQYWCQSCCTIEFFLILKIDKLICQNVFEKNLRFPRLSLWVNI